MGQGYRVTVGGVAGGRGFYGSKNIQSGVR